MAKADRLPDFERSLDELEKLVERLEHGDLPLDEALKTFERGVALTRTCQAALKTAQQRVEVLQTEGGEPQAVPYDAAEEGSSSEPPAE
jgi:exodeoxyribonuclease VII small subunit